MSTRWLAPIGAVALFLGWLSTLIWGESSLVGTERYWWLADDGMISMRYARNLANGLGFVWNPGERVEGYTNFLWTVFMAGVHLLPLPESQLSLVVLLAALCIAALACSHSYTWRTRLAEGGWPRVRQSSPMG